MAVPNEQTRKSNENPMTELTYLSAFVVDLAKEGERVAVVMGVAQVDIFLERVLKSLLNRHPGGQDSLFDPDRPLSTFSAKIALAYRLGIIDSDFEHALQMLRKIRNDFAHSTEPERLSGSRHQSRLNDMLRTMKTGPWFGDIRKIIMDEKLPPELIDFSTAICGILVLLDVVLKKKKPKS